MPSLRDRLTDDPRLFYLIANLISLLLLFSRRPDAILSPQFWAEDGKIWFADAYNHGIAYSVMTPEAGYYQTLSRLVAISAQLFPFAFAPAIFNFAAIALKLIVVNFLLSGRLAALAPNLGTRIFIAFLYIALPYSFETHANLTNAQWHLGLLCLLVLISSKEKSIAWSAFDVVAVILSSLSGPLCIFLSVIGGIKCYRDRDMRSFLLTLILVAGSLMQIFALLGTARPSTQPLGAEFALGVQIIAGQLFVSSVIGQLGHSVALKVGLLNYGTSILVCITGFALMAIAFIRARIELRLLIIFSAMIVLGALVSPAVSSELPQWQAMIVPGAGSRYYFIPIFTIFILLVHFATDTRKVFMRWSATALLVLSFLGIAADWRYPRFKDLDFQSHADRFEEAPSGSEVVIPINPNWEMRLRKK